MSNRVLVIEDNEENLYLVTFLLEKAGYEVAAARDGVTGVKRAQEIRPALILLDIQLPGMDGYEVARALRREPDLEKTPIVAVTSYAMGGDREQALAAGCTGYIEKPINPDTFLDQIRAFAPPTTGGTP